MQLPKTKKEAQALNFPKYLTGKSCKQGHAGPRYAANGACCACHANYTRKAKGQSPKLMPNVTHRIILSDPAHVPVMLAYVQRLKDETSAATQREIAARRAEIQDIGRREDAQPVPGFPARIT